MLKTKKLYRLMAGLLAALMICASVPSVAYATEGGAEETVEPTMIEVNVEFWCETEYLDGERTTLNVGNNSSSVLESLSTFPSGYELASTGDFWIDAEQEYLKVEVRPVNTEEPEEPVEPTTIEVNVEFWCGTEYLDGERTTLNVGNNNSSVLESLSTFPSGYELASTGDFWIDAEQEYLKVEVRPVNTEEPEEPVEPTTIEVNVEFWCGTEYLDGERTTLNVGNNNSSVLESLSTFPSGYELASTGDFWIDAEQEYLKVEVRPVNTEEPEEPDDTTKEVIMNIQFVTADGEVAGGGDYFLPEGVQNYSVLNQYLPEGYKLAVSGDFFVKEGESIEVRVEKIAEDIIMNISFKDGEEVVGGGDYFVPAGVQNYSVLEQYVPEGYRMTVSGDFMAEAGAHLDVSVEKTEKDVIMNIRFVTADGTFVSGGDYFLPEGIQNFSILEQYVPVGYQMLESGDFTVVEGGKEDVTVEKISDEVIVNISFIDRYGNVIAGGDYFVPEGIQNRNVLDRYVPDGYTQAETGDINFTAGGHYDIVLDEATSIVNIQFIDRESKEVVAGGDYTVPTGIHNRTILNQYVPEGYRQVVTGDIEFIYGQHYEILIEKDTAIVNIRFIDRDGNFIAGGDYFVPLGIVNRSVLDQYVPEGYRQAVTGDIEFVAGGEYEIIIEKIAENVVSKTAIFRKGETDIWNENPDNPDEVHYTFFSDDKTATCIVPSVTVADETKELDYWVSDVDGTVKLYPGQAFCYNDLDKGELEGYAGDFAFYPVYKDKTVEEPTDPGTEEPANPGTGDPSTPGNGGSDSGNSNGSSGSGSGSSASKSDAPADNSSKILPKTGYGENTIPTAGITAVSLAAVCGAAGYAFIARRRVR